MPKKLSLAELTVDSFIIGQNILYGGSGKIIDPSSGPSEDCDPTCPKDCEAIEVNDRR